MTESREFTTTRPRLRHLLAVLIMAATCAVTLATVNAGPAAAYESCPAYTAIGGGASSYGTGSGWALNPANEIVYQTSGGQACVQGSQLMCVGWAWYYEDGQWLATHAVYEPVNYDIYFSGPYMGFSLNYTACDWIYQPTPGANWCQNDALGGAALWVRDSLPQWNQANSGWFQYCADGSNSAPYPRITGTDGYIFKLDGGAWYWQTSAAVWHRY